MFQEFCSYCPDFEPEVEKIDCSSLTEQVKYCTNIRCTQRARCARLAINIRKQVITDA